MPRTRKVRQIVISPEAQDWAKSAGWDGQLDGAQRLLVAYRVYKRKSPGRRMPEPQEFSDLASELRDFQERAARLAARLDSGKDQPKPGDE